MNDGATVAAFVAVLGGTSLLAVTARWLRPTGDLPALESWALYWERWVSAAFLQGYLRRARGAPFLPASREERQVLLDSYLLEKAIYEMGYELNNRPDWLRIPLRGIRQILEGEG